MGTMIRLGSMNSVLDQISGAIFLLPKELENVLDQIFEENSGKIERKQDEQRQYLVLHLTDHVNKLSL